MPLDSADALDDMRAWRRHLHAHPELAFEETETSDFVAERLSSFGIQIHRGLGGTGVVGTLRLGTSTRAIGLRADMDALPMPEANTFAHRSVYAGKMHACGHDGHMAMLLGAARQLAKEGGFDGTVHFIFQPAEEAIGGAKRMIEDGLFDLFPVDAVFGLHNMPMIPAGFIGMRPGPMMASSDSFEITIVGNGTHGALPHRGVDAIAVAAEIVLAFNQIAARTIDPMEPAVISVTQFHAGTVFNVLPPEATIGGTVRAFNQDVRSHIEARMRQVSEGIAAAHGARIEFGYTHLYPPTINHVSETAFAAKVAASVVGADRVIQDLPANMGAEDFAWMLEVKPGCYAWIGNGEGEDGGCMVHNPGYDFNDNILGVGARYWVGLARTYLAPSASDA